GGRTTRSPATSASPPPPRLIPSHHKRPALRVGFRPATVGGGRGAEPNNTRSRGHGRDEAASVLLFPPRVVG
ncbi:unnamed protein product, partial [Urochloa humidicola]